MQILKKLKKTYRIQIVTGVEVITIFCQKFVKCFIETEGQEKHFTNREQKKLMMIDDTDYFLFCYTSKSKQKN